MIIVRFYTRARGEDAGDFWLSRDLLTDIRYWFSRCHRILLFELARRDVRVVGLLNKIFTDFQSRRFFFFNIMVRKSSKAILYL